MAGCFFAEAGVGAGYYDCFGGEGVGGEGDFDEELVVEEAEDGLHGWLVFGGGFVRSKRERWVMMII